MPVKRLAPSGLEVYAGIGTFRLACSNAAVAISSINLGAINTLAHEPGRLRCT
ncbi:hypothetical protein [Flavobacterium sp. LAR06]|uniref:hypothetical protein n=1 Tax=Flavobacterium sp. LAR06 TaxID=3064897 RepID=UPI0035C10F83